MTARHLLNQVAPIERRTMGDHAYRQIADLLIAGRLAPGDKLSLRSMAQALGVSMMPIREAVTRLVADGALEVTPKRAIRVPVMSAARFKDLTSVRVEIEGHAAELAAKMRSSEEVTQIAALEEAFRKETGKKRPDRPRAVACNQALHFKVYETAKSPTLLDIIRSLWLKAGPVINLDLRANPERMQKTAAKVFHAELLAAIAEGDGKAAREAMTKDIEGAADFILSRGTLPD